MFLTIDSYELSNVLCSSFKAVPRDADTWEAVQDASLVSLVSHSAPPTSPTTIAMPPPELPNQLSQLSELASLCLPLPPSHPATSDGTTVKFVVNAGFDPLLRRHQQFEPPRSREKNVRWTENQREMAATASNPASQEELTSLVRISLLLYCALFDQFQCH